MIKLSCLTPYGQVTIPRSIMKSLGISQGNDLIIEVENGQLVLKKLEKCNDNDKSSFVYKV